jgi:type II secretory pathway component PulF
MFGLYADVSALLRLGIPLTLSLDTFARHCHPGRLRDVVTRLRDTVETGAELHREMGALPAIFPASVVGCIRIGEHELLLENEFAVLEQAYLNGVLPNTRHATCNDLALWFAQLALLSSDRWQRRSEAQVFELCATVFADSGNRAVAEAVADVAQRFQHGESRHQAFSPHVNLFGDVILGTVEAVQATPWTELEKPLNELSIVLARRLVLGLHPATDSATMLQQFFASLRLLLHRYQAPDRAIQCLAAACPDNGFRKCIDALAVSIARGDSIGHALGEHPQYFSEAVCLIVRSAEASGDLDASLAEIVKLYDRESAFVD